MSELLQPAAALQAVAALFVCEEPVPRSILPPVLDDIKCVARFVNKPLFKVSSLMFQLQDLFSNSFTLRNTLIINASP